MRGLNAGGRKSGHRLEKGESYDTESYDTDRKASLPDKLSD